MKYNPKEAEQSSFQLPDGIYDAECVSAKDEISKAGNDMLVLNWKVFGNDGDSTLIRDYIVASAQWKLKQAMEGCAMETESEKDVEAGDFVGQSARVLVEKDGEYNKIKKYVAAAGKAKKLDDLDGDGIPF